MLGAALPGWAQEAAKAASTQVVITGSLSDTAARRDFVAGKIIIGRKRIEESGVRRVDELLKREPSVTVRGDGSIGLLNMPGYTQILVDGQAPLSGQSPGQLDLVHVEKIEIIKSSVAQFGPFGIAGTINIVSRKTVRKTDTRLSTGMSNTGGKSTANLSLSHNQSTEGSPLRFNVDLSAEKGSGTTERHVRQTLTPRGQSEQDQWQAAIGGTSRNAFLLGSGNLTWQRGPDETVSFSPEIMRMGGPGRQDESRRWAGGTILNVQEEKEGSFQGYTLPVKWLFKPSKTSQVDMNLSSRLMRIRSDLARTDTDGLQSTLRNSALRTEKSVNSFSLAYRASLTGGHDLSAGTTLSAIKNDTDYDYSVNGLPDTAREALGTERQSLSKSLRLYMQDEWRVNERWALNAGMSGQGTAIDITESRYRGQSSFRLWSPSLHVSKKIGDDDKRQLRFSLAQSFKEPHADSFTVRPDIHPLAPCNANGACGPNTIETADRTGNLALRPERSLGLNLSYEHGIGDDSQITLEFFTRDITGKIGSEITLDTVAWSSSPRYVSRPTNLGDASTAGINLEMELALSDIAKNAPKIELHGSVGLARSHVSSLPGPDNRLDKQTPWTAKLGGSYSVPGLPLKFDLNADWSPSVWVRTSLSERVSVAREFTLDASAKWAISKESRLVVSFKTLSPHSPLQINEYIAANEQVRQYSNTRKFNFLSVQFETKL